MNPFAYVRPADGHAAMQAIASAANARYIAGGTNILDLMKDDVERPPLLVISTKSAFATSLRATIRSFLER